MTTWNRLVTAVGIGAVSLLSVGAPCAAQPAHTHARPEPQDATADTEAAAQAQRDKRDKQDKQARAERDQRQRRLPRQAQEIRVREQEQRLTQYREHLAQQQALARDQHAQLQRQNRVNQLRSQQEYVVRLRQQQLEIDRRGRYDYYGDPFVSTPSTYRYARGGQYYETNQYGIDLLRRAVNYGYQEGRRAGIADRSDRWRGGYENSYAFEDATYGYSGFYVDPDDYRNYFREGFRRGYDDGLGARSAYGRFANGRGTILGSVLSIILSVEVIR